MYEMPSQAEFFALFENVACQDERALDSRWQEAAPL